MLGQDLGQTKATVAPGLSLTSSTTAGDEPVTYRRHTSESGDSDMISGEPSYRPKVKVGTDTEYMDLWVAAQFAGIKYDRDEYDRLFMSKN